MAPRAGTIAVLRGLEASARRLADAITAAAVEERKAGSNRWIDLDAAAMRVHDVARDIDRLLRRPDRPDSG